MEPRPLKRAKRYVRYLLLRVLYFFVCLSPPCVSTRVGAVLGLIAFRLARKQRENALRSLAIAFPELSDAERWSLARRSFRHMGVSAGEVCALRWIAPRLERYVELPEADFRVLQEALAAGRGVMYVTGHVGNFELMARRIAGRGTRSHTIAKPPSCPRLTAWLERIRMEGKVHTIWRGRGTAIPEMLAALGRNEMVGMLIDQDTRVRGVWVDFFGRKAFTPRSAADFALQSGAAVVCGFIFRKPEGGHRVKLVRVPLPTEGEPEQRTVALTQEMTLRIEEAIREAPEAWVWIHQRWKTQPPADTVQASAA